MLLRWRWAMAASQTGRVGRDSGYDAYALRTAKFTHLGAGAKLSATGEKHELSLTQDHGAMEGRPIIREATLKEYAGTPHFAKAFDMEKPPAFMPLYTNPFDEAKKLGHHQWGMSIDLSACVGCSSCMVACQSENNIPIVGKSQVANNREMHWIRIDRYYTGSAADPQVVNQPMLCQHCEAAPCENVCPVNATVHDQEGLNVMVYNRCVGTRYCSNNCPYKVRRFNFFDYNRRTLEQLKGPVYSTPLVPINGQRGVIDWLKDPDRGNKPTDEWELLKLVKIPRSPCACAASWRKMQPIASSASRAPRSRRRSRPAPPTTSSFRTASSRPPASRPARRRRLSSAILPTRTARSRSSRPRNAITMSSIF